jgi:hypothetical protein
LIIAIKTRPGITRNVPGGVDGSGFGGTGVSVPGDIVKDHIEFERVPWLKASRCEIGLMNKSYGLPAMCVELPGT